MATTYLSLQNVPNLNADCAYDKVFEPSISNLEFSVNSTPEAPVYYSSQYVGYLARGYIYHTIGELIHKY